MDLRLRQETWTVDWEKGDRGKGLLHKTNATAPSLFLFRQSGILLSERNALSEGIYSCQSGMLSSECNVFIKAERSCQSGMLCLKA